jgi:hypothetical protein
MNGQFPAALQYAQLSWVKPSTCAALLNPLLDVGGVNEKTMTWCAWAPGFDRVLTMV